ncbi:hypothetical protein [Streptomyces sp. NPDC005244]|uniref:hypothetical protein n=1 Tax=Streptomyces sp. NPDC005244 TaxID=3364708 RepID=UPI0036C6E4F5
MSAPTVPQPAARSPQPAAGNSASGSAGRWRHPVRWHHPRTDLSLTDVARIVTE